VGDFRQRIGLVHELRKLAGTEELAHRCTDRFGVDQIMRHEIIRFRLRQALLDGPLDADEPSTKLVFRQFAHGAHTAIT